MGWNKFAAAAYARHNARASSHGICATYVRLAIRAGGIELPITHFAKDYGPVLISAGFRPLKPGETPQTGDIVVIQPRPGGNPAGHIALFDGSTWYSDFRQRDMWGGPGYRQAKPSHVIYRMP